MNRNLNKPIFKYDIGDLIQTNNRNLKIIDREYRGKNKHVKYYSKKINSYKECDYIENQKFYKYRCLNCDNEDWILEQALSSMGKGCNSCCNAPKKIVKGYNDIATTAKWMIPYLYNKDDAYKYFKHDNRNVKMVCPYCGKIQMKKPKLISVHQSLQCSCMDSVSYPNKFIYEVLRQFNIEFEPEKVFSWSKPKRYDVYFKFNGTKNIIEMHGKQHYEENSFTARTLENEKINDEYKYTIALQNGIDNYYQIDSSVSSCDYIKNSIIHSGLFELLGITSNDINWIRCDEYATSNTDKEIAEYHEQNPLIGNHELSLLFSVSEDRITRAVNKGIEFGWCSKTMWECRKDRNIEHNSKPLFCETDGTYFANSNIASEIMSNGEVKYISSAIRKASRLNGKYKGKQFKHISREEFNEAKSKFPDKCHGNFFNIKENVA